MGATDAGLRKQATGKLDRARKQIESGKYDDAMDSLTEVWDILKVLKQK